MTPEGLGPGAPAAAWHLSAAEVDDLVDGVLSPSERAAAEGHAAACAVCGRAVADAQGMLAAARALRPGVAAPPELWPLVASATLYAGETRRRVLRSLRGPLAVGALALVLATAALTAQLLGWLRPGPDAAARAEAAGRGAAARRAAVAEERATMERAATVERSAAAERDAVERGAASATRPPAPPAPPRPPRAPDAP